MLMTDTPAKTSISPRERHPGGHVKAQQTVGRAAIAPTLVRRIMDHAVKLANDPRCASQLGRLYMTGQLTDSEFEAALNFAEDVGRWDRAQGMPRRSAKSPGWEMGFGDGRVDLTALRRMDTERAAKAEERIKLRIEKASKALQKALNCIPLNSRSIVHDICCDDLAVNSYYLPRLRQILGDMAKHCYQLNTEVARPRTTKERKAKPGDAALLAEAATDALAAWFEENNNTAQAFAIGAGKHKTRRITVYGVWTKTNMTPVSHSIEVRLRGLPPPTLDAALFRASIAKGWAEASKRRLV